MKVRAATTKGDEERQRFKLSIDGKVVLNVGRGEPEDNYLFRDLNFVYSITKWMRLAHAAGAAGQALEIENVKDEADEDDDYDGD